MKRYLERAMDIVERELAMHPRKTFLEMSASLKDQMVDHFNDIVASLDLTDYEAAAVLAAPFMGAIRDQSVRSTIVEKVSSWREAGIIRDEIFANFVEQSKQSSEEWLDEALATPSEYFVFDQTDADASAGEEDAYAEEGEDPDGEGRATGPSASDSNTAAANKLMVEASQLVDRSRDEKDSETKVHFLGDALRKMNEIIERYPETDLAVRLATQGKEGRISLSGIKRQILQEETRRRGEDWAWTMKERLKKFGADLKSRQDAIQRKEEQLRKRVEQDLADALPRLLLAADIFAWIMGGETPRGQPEEFRGRFSKERTRKLKRAINNICEQALYSGSSFHEVVVGASNDAAKENDEGQFDAVMLLTTFGSADKNMTILKNYPGLFRTDHADAAVGRCAATCYEVVRSVLGNDLPVPFGRSWPELELNISELRTPL